VVTAGPDEGVEACLLKMQKTGCRHLPIVSGKELIGFVSIKDLLMLELTRRSREVKSLKMLLWAEDIPSQDVEETWQCGGCKRTIESELPPIHCPKCNAPRFQFTIVSR
jgi:predicted transcriptional regulator